MPLVLIFGANALGNRPCAWQIFESWWTACGGRSMCQTAHRLSRDVSKVEHRGHCRLPSLEKENQNDCFLQKKRSQARFISKLIMFLFWKVISRRGPFGQHITVPNIDTHTYCFALETNG